MRLDLIRAKRVSTSIFIFRLIGRLFKLTLFCTLSASGFHINNTTLCKTSSLSGWIVYSRSLFNFFEKVQWIIVIFLNTLQLKFFLFLLQFLNVLDMNIQIILIGLWLSLFDYDLVVFVKRRIFRLRTIEWLYVRVLQNWRLIKIWAV